MAASNNQRFRIEPELLRRTVRLLQEALQEPAIKQHNQARIMLDEMVKQFGDSHSEEECLKSQEYNRMKIARESANRQFYEAILGRFPNFSKKFPTIFQGIINNVLSDQDLSEFLNLYEQTYTGVISFEDMARFGVNRMERGMGLAPGSLSMPPPNTPANTPAETPAETPDTKPESTD